MQSKIGYLQPCESAQQNASRVQTGCAKEKSPKVFNFVTLFPQLIAPYFEASILARACASGAVLPRFFDPREQSLHPHKKVDDYAIGGGAGLLLHPQPMFDTLERLKHSHVVFVTPAGKPFRQADARRLARLDAEITIVCGRYEGIDERVIERYANEVFCIGDFVLTGGELPALCMADAIARNIPGVIREESLENESFEGSLLEAPAFAKPIDYWHDFTPQNVAQQDKIRLKQNVSTLSARKKFSAIFTFVKGNHAKINALKNQLSLCKTKFHRPDLLAAHHYLRIKDEK